MSDTFCVMPWLAKEIYPRGRIGHCCWLPQDYDIDLIRTEISNGIKTSACQKCWNSEDLGQTSRRQQQNILADTLYDLDIENLKKICTHYQPTIYQITTSNVCNAACIMCSPNYSSMWESLDGIAHKRTIGDELLNEIDFDTAKYVELLGGETLLESKNIEILERLNKDCTVSIITNGSIELTEDLLTVLKKFKKLILCLSIDGIESRYEYQRWPLKWDKLLVNLEKFKSIGCDISVHFALTNVLLPYKQETLDWFEKNNLNWFISEVTQPACFNPRTPINEQTIQELDRQDMLKGIRRQDYGINI